MPSFQGHDEIILRPDDTGSQYSFEVTQCSSATANDGFLPYGVSVSSITVTTHKRDSNNTTVTDIIVGTPSVVDNVVYATLKYPSTNGEGRYKLKIVAALDTGKDKELVFDRIKAEDF